MEFRRVGDALLRSPHCIIPSPSIFLRASQRPLISLSTSHQRSFTTTRPAFAAAPQRAPAPPRTTTPAAPDELTESLNSLINSSILDTPSRPPPARSSSANISAAFGKTSFGNYAPRTPARGPPSSRGLDFDRMQMPAGTPSMPSNLPPPPTPLAAQAAPPRFNASSGRSIELDPMKGRDLIRGLGMLNSLVSRNKVKSDVHAQRFHERAGLKRKRLHGERWRKRFKVGFRSLTERVAELTRKGW
ncbi:hypothetical protein BU16DRAFT_531617 [Lophium mytilinum]|uniref:Ribosomal protein S21 n=1 Tax=Lophium mytilinum TaxID=390894 RepID=A0A6A6QA41_9PEZI|nr:hypothetical protein BU16DRAFT_531617 [Lophium mytilinum]